VNPDILGGIVVRVGDTVMDGSVRRRLGALRALLT
jgi:F-type H+-transporting ATPase subunit delta